MKVSLINEVMNIKKIMGLIKEDTELSSQSSDLSKVQSLLDLQDIDIKAEELLDEDEPICTPPKRLSEEENNLVSKYWELANNSGNKLELKKIFKKIKDMIYDDEDLSDNIIIGDLELSKNDIKSIGDTLLAITVVGLIPKVSDCNK